MNDVTRILWNMGNGDSDESERLKALVNGELRRISQQQLAREGPGQTLNVTALVHEAYIRLVDGRGAHCWKNDAHFYAAAALAMRRIIIERARSKGAEKRGGRVRHRDVAAVEIAAPTPTPLEDLLALNMALEKLEAEHPEPARLVNLRYFAGLNEKEAAAALDVSRATVQRQWRFAKAWLLNELSGGGEPPADPQNPAGP